MLNSNKQESSSLPLKDREAASLPAKSTFVFDEPALQIGKDSGLV